MFATKVTVGCGFFVDRVQQIQHLNQTVWTQVEELTHQQGQLFRRHFLGAKGFHHDGRRFCNADSVGNLNFATIGQACGNDVLRHIARRVGCGTVNFRWIFTGERAAAVASHAAVGINDDLTTGQTAVAHRAANNETAGRVDEEFGGRVEPFGRQNRLDDLFHHCFLQGFLIDIFRVLSRQNDRVDADDFAVVILEGHLAFRIRAQPRQGAVFTHFSLTLHQTVSVSHRRRHQHVGFVSGVAKHQPLVAGALFQRIGTVNALVNVRRLFTNGAQYGARVGVKAHIGMHVANFADGVAGDLFDINPCAGGDFAAYQHHAGFDIGFTCDTRFRILLEDRIQHGIGDLVSNFVRMPF
ncbi:Uncharacterised protein [Klebsiella pneumoniae]|nr:Uncharacterised protein [Klebsiella pneumoniae]